MVYKASQGYNFIKLYLLKTREIHHWMLISAVLGILRKEGAVTLGMAKPNKIIRTQTGHVFWQKEKGGGGGATWLQFGSMYSTSESVTPPPLGWMKGQGVHRG